MRVILDTNVFIDALFTGDKDCNLILKRESNGEFILVMNHDMNEELQRMIKIFIDNTQAEKMEILYIYKLLSRILLRTDNIKFKTRFDKCEDNDDNMFFECAIDGNANFIVSKDKHIQKLRNTGIKNKNKEVIEILYPDELIERLDKIKLNAHFGN